MITSNADPKIQIVMNFALDQACEILPSNLNNHCYRSFVARKILERASQGDLSHGALVRAGRRAITQLFAMQAKSA
jgi:hypothetical protein